MSTVKDAARATMASLTNTPMRASPTERILLGVAIAAYVVFVFILGMMVGIGMMT